MIPIAKPIIGEEEKNAVRDILDSGMIVQGPKVKEFEERFAAYCSTEYAVAVNSGTAALHASLYAVGIKPGDEVITVPFTFVATANSTIMQSAKPVFVDINEDDFNIDADKVQEKITKKTKAILPVNLYGQPYDVEEIRNIAEDNNLFVVEDACQSVGAEYKNKKSGTFGDIAAFSFYATKNMVTGEGGMITTDNKEFAELCRRFRHHGQSEQTRYEYHDLGYNYRMTDLSAAIGLEQLKKINKLNDKRIKNAKLLTDGLSKIDSVAVPKIKNNCKHVFHQYTVKVDEKIRDKLVEHLKKNGIGTGIYYPKPLHLHKNFLRFKYGEGDFPISEKLSKEVISLPVHPLITEEEVNKIIKIIGDFDG